MGTMESGDDLNEGNEERIFVSVRLRPLNEKEILRNDVSDWECINDKTIVYRNVGLSASDRSMYPTAYTFDRVFRSDCSTKEVYDKGAKDVAVSVLSGMNSSVFAYGQTSSGKTYTMTGVTEYALADIYDYINKHHERDFVLKFSAMEIYNESVRDLLSVDNAPLRLLDDPERGTIVEKLTEEILRDWSHVVQLLSVCEAQRRNGETLLNEMSSRSHQIIRLTIESSSREFVGRDNASTLTATVNFIDLAGSERASQSLSAGTRLKEGCHINRSLLTLGTVIRKLSKGRGGHIPYRDSKLTRILQTSLGGNARTAIICTMSPARIHVEQSRNTLLFASCAKEVTTNAQVNVVMSDKALVKYLQRELARLEGELRSPQATTFVPSNYSEIMREKDRQIEKLEEEINDLILQRDIAQSQVKDLLQMLGDNASNASSVPRVGLGHSHYPHLRVHKSPSPNNGITESETPISAALDVDSGICSDGQSRTSSEDQIAKIPYFDDDSYSYHGWGEIDKQSDRISEDQCREVRCIETEDQSSNKGATESNYSFSEEYSGFPDVKAYVNEDTQTIESPSTPLEKDQVFESSLPRKKDNETNGEVKPGILPSNEDQNEEKESSCKKEEQVTSIRFLGTPPPPENSSSTHELDQDSSVNICVKMNKSQSCKASIIGSASPWSKIMDLSENASSFGSEREYAGFERKLSPLSIDTDAQSLSRKDSQSSPGNSFDIEIDTPNAKFSTPEDATIEPSKKNVKDIGLDPIEDESKNFSSWPVAVEFKTLQREIIELWHACNVSLIHRTYFFMLFQGDPSDAIYLQVEMRRMKFLKDKFSQGEATFINGQRLTLTSSAKALREERKVLSRRMMKKLSEQERESLFLKWGIGLNAKMRRLQLAHCLWTKTDDMDHVTDSAYLVSKLVGLVESGKYSHDKEMFGLNFTPRSTSRTYSFRRSIISLL